MYVMCMYMHNIDNMRNDTVHIVRIGSQHFPILAVSQNHPGNSSLKAPGAETANEADGE